MSKSHVQVYLFFGGRCDEALEFYRTAVGAQVDFVMRYCECPVPMPPGQLPAGFENKVMHATFRIGDTVMMASDGHDVVAKFADFSLSLAVTTEAEAQQAFAALGVGGKVTMPLGKTFWSPCFGMLKDKFGLSWMVSLPGETPAKK
jgi:PhnB protein